LRDLLGGEGQAVGATANGAQRLAQRSLQCLQAAHHLHDIGAGLADLDVLHQVTGGQASCVAAELAHEALQQRSVEEQDAQSRQPAAQ
jgi:hypothetical protein